MKHQICFTWITACLTGLTILITGCASNSGGQHSALNAADSGLASVEQSAQAGRQAIQTSTAAATEITNQTNAAIASGATAAGNIKNIAETTGGQMGLANILSRQLGVTQPQALGGAGAIFQAAQAGMEPQAFATLAQSVPGMTEMLNAAPTVSSPLSGVSSMLGGTNNTLNSAVGLAASFQQLNLSPDMVGQFVPIVTNYVRNTSGQVTANLLRSALNVP